MPFWWLHFTGPGCSGFKAMVFNAVFNLLLLGLFVDFHRRTFRVKGKPLQTDKKQD